MLSKDLDMGLDKNAPMISGDRDDFQASASEFTPAQIISMESKKRARACADESDATGVNFGDVIPQGSIVQLQQLPKLLRHARKIEHIRELSHRRSRAGAAKRVIDPHLQRTGFLPDATNCI